MHVYMYCLWGYVSLWEGIYLHLGRRPKQVVLYARRLRCCAKVCKGRQSSETEVGDSVILCVQNERVREIVRVCSQLCHLGKWSETWYFWHYSPRVTLSSEARPAFVFDNVAQNGELLANASMEVVMPNR